MPDAVEIKLAPIVRAPESRIGEINMTVSAHHNIVRRVEFHALPVLRQHLRIALQIQPGHASCFRFANIQAPLRIVRKAGRPAIVVFQNFRMRIGIDSENPALPDIRCGQKSGSRPRKPIDELQVRCNLLSFVVGSAARELWQGKPD
jgi:hypothetical protein